MRLEELSTTVEDQTSTPIAHKPVLSGRGKMAWAVFGFLAGALLLWLSFEWVFKAFPYLTSGGEVIYHAKVRQETQGTIFPEKHDSLRLLVFGSSRAMAGFIPDDFDTLARADGLRTTSYNSGYPARTGFLNELKQIVAHGQIPDVVVLTEVWDPKPEQTTLFRFLFDDFDTAQKLFPFRDLPRDVLNFLVDSRNRGGPLKFYDERRQIAAKMLEDRGYYFIAEQSHFAGNRLPPDFRLPTDTPDKPKLRKADAASPQLAELNALLKQHHIACYFAPSYARIPEGAPPPPIDADLAKILSDSGSPCRLIGPDYINYPNDLFSDQMHLNPDGAKFYTRALYGYLSNVLKENSAALQ